MAEKLPKAVEGLMSNHKDVWEAYSQLGAAVAAAGPLDAKTQRLIKLALAIGGGSEGAVHSHVRRGLAEGCSAEELQQVAILAIPTLGLPRCMAARTWIEDILNKA